MGKLLIVFAFYLLVAYAQGQNGQEQEPNADVESATLTPEDEALQFSNVALDVVVTRLAAANLPPELELAGQQILADTEEGLTQCSETLKTTHLIWQSKVCAAAQMRNALAAIKALQMASTAAPTSSA